MTGLIKKYYFTIIFLLIIISCSKHGTSPNLPNDPWQKINSPIIGEPLDMKFVSADTGYILGVKYSDDSIYNILISTYDGGQNWKTIAYRNHQFLTDTSNGLLQSIYVSPFKSNILFTGGNNLLRSTDGGASWKRVDTVNKKGTTNMVFFDPANGISSTGEGISRTTDSGLTWTTFYTPMMSFQLLPFTSPHIGYFAGGSENDGLATGIMSKTIDGGNIWNLLNYPFDDIVSVSFVNDNIGYVSMITATGNIAQDQLGSKLIKTTDGGNSWQIIQQNPNDNSGSGYYNLHFMSETEGFCTNNGVLHSIDGGNTWAKESEIRVSLLCFPDMHTAYAVDTSGIVYKRTF
jgi:photosystem II stability/assembly factor-like uncharacterized protein